MNQTRKHTGSTVGKLLTERIAVWSLPLGVLVIAGAFYAGNLNAGGRKAPPSPTGLRLPVVYGVPEPVYPSPPKMAPARELETDLIISANPKPKPILFERPAVKDNRIVQQPESVDSRGQQAELTTMAPEETASVHDAPVFKMDPSRPTEPSNAAVKSSEPPRRYSKPAEKPRLDSTARTSESQKDDQWNGETRRRYDSFFSDADFRDGHRYGGR